MYLLEKTLFAAFYQSLCWSAMVILMLFLTQSRLMSKKQGNCANPRLFISSNSMSSKALTRFHAWAKAKFCALGAPWWERYICLHRCWILLGHQGSQSLLQLTLTIPRDLLGLRANSIHYASLVASQNKLVSWFKPSKLTNLNPTCCMWETLSAWV